jgi:hypothetical protein
MVVLSEDRFPGIGKVDTGAPARAEIRSTQITENARVGLLFVDSSGVVSGITVSRNRIGLVLPGELRPTLEGGNALQGNEERDAIFGGDLPVVSDSLPLP